MEVVGSFVRLRGGVVQSLRVSTKRIYFLWGITMGILWFWKVCRMPGM
jgi:hypothetical protein